MSFSVPGVTHQQLTEMFSDMLLELGPRMKNVEIELVTSVTAILIIQLLTLILALINVLYMLGKGCRSNEDVHESDNGMHTYTFKNVKHKSRDDDKLGQKNNYAVEYSEEEDDDDNEFDSDHNDYCVEEISQNSKRAVKGMSKRPLIRKEKH